MPIRKEKKQTPYSLLVREWRDCQLCHLAKHRHKVVMARGQIPCDVLFVGEAPGMSEDLTGRPFEGPVGHALDQIIADAIRGEVCTRCHRYQTAGKEPCGCQAPTRKVRCAYANVVGCVPRKDDGTRGGAPDEDSIQACRPRLEALAVICRPRLIICVGAVSRTLLEPGMYAHSFSIDRAIPREDVKHPGAMFKESVTQRRRSADLASAAIQRAVETHLG
jgi:uracil-DNA glycosylase